MPLKTLPQVNDLNWGTPLNAHIGQLQSSVDGGINKFEQFSERPNNLTADDQGKTYLYTQTGNLHQWTGTTWKVLNESVINVKDYGAVGDGVSDDTPFIQPLCDNSYGREIYFPAGNYRVNLDLKTRTNNITGQGNKNTFLKSFSPTGYVITIDSFDFWKSTVFSNFTLVGDNLTSGGIQFGKPNSLDPNTSSLSGTLFLKNVDFQGFDICINKRYGNIGNSYDGCSFYGSNYHYVANEVTGYEHAGIDSFYRCHFFGASKASIYFNCPDGSTGQTTLRDCVFEGNSGLCIFSKGYSAGNSPFNPVLKLENVWWENNGIHYHDGTVLSNVDIFGTVYDNCTMHLEKTNILMDNTSILDFGSPLDKNTTMVYNYLYDEQKQVYF